MVKISVKGQEQYFDGFLLKDLQFIRRAVLDHNNLFTLVMDGRVGSGKSTLAVQIACYLDPRFNLNKVCFNVFQFKKALKEAETGDCLLLDESFDSLNRRKAASSANMELLSLLQMMRHKKVFIILVLPSVYDLDKNILLNLCDLFCHVYRQQDFGARGFFSMYDRVGLKRLYIYCRQALRYSLKVAKPIYKGRFTSNFLIDNSGYSKKKTEAIEINREGGRDKKSALHHRQERDKAIRKMRDMGLSVEDICDALDLSKSAVYNAINGINDKKLED